MKSRNSFLSHAFFTTIWKALVSARATSWEGAGAGSPVMWGNCLMAGSCSCVPSSSHGQPHQLSQPLPAPPAK